MEPFATSYDLETKLQTDFTFAQAVAADQALEQASATFRDWSGQTVYPVQTGIVRSWYGVATFRLFLPHPAVIPVTVASVTVDGDALDAADWRIDEIHSLTRTVGQWRGDVTVTYSHGFAVPPQSVAGAVLSVVSRTFDNPAGVTQETVGPFNRSFGNASVQGWRADELRVLDQFRQVTFS